MKKTIGKNTIEDIMSELAGTIAVQEPEPHWFNVKQFSEHIGLSNCAARERIRKLVKQGALKQHKIFYKGKHTTYFEKA